MNKIAQNILMHYGMPRRSGRYPWGSGENPYQHSGDFLARYEQLKAEGWKDADIAEEFNTTHQNLRTYITIAKHERRQLQRDRVLALTEEGKNPTEIARIMGFKNESSVRNLLREDINSRKNMGQKTADTLRTMLDSGKMLDVGAGSNLELGVSENQLREAIVILEGEGYKVHQLEIPQTTNKNQRTTNLVITKDGVTDKDVWNNMDKVEGLIEYHSNDGGETYQKFEYPASIDSKRVKVRYAEDGGLERDGTIELRRGVEDLDLGDAAYAQVRILVDGTHYLKGMAMYGNDEDFPKGTDIIFNTNKTKNVEKMDVFKKIGEEDPENPFGAQLAAAGQSHYIGKDGKEHLSAINKLKTEGEWDEMSRSLSSQFLSKQPMSLIKKQLNLTYANAEDEYAEIMSLTNPTLKKKMLLDYADECDGAAQHLKAAALPRQACQVILPLPKIKETEAFAPNFENGEQLALVRYPHGGQFEIPIVTVNNKYKEGQSRFGLNAKDVIGINPKVASQLSGADFDGDFVIAIPTNNGKVSIKNKQPLRDLKDFEPKTQYRGTDDKGNVLPGVRILQKGDATQREMGIVSNLITDMTLHGANEAELARAVRHSMVIIDAAKHKLDYKRSEKDNNIAELKRLYQAPYNEVRDENGNVISTSSGGASTLFSRRKQTVRVPERKGGPRIDPETGEVTYRTSGRKYYNAKGQLVDAQIEVSRISQTKDLNTLSSGTPQERAYAEYGNKMKAMANRCRKEAMAIKDTTYSPEAHKEYDAEVKSLTSKLNVAMKNAPVERAANRIANIKRRDTLRGIENPKERKEYAKKTKYRQMALNQARAQVGKKTREATQIKITDREWEAIQKGAISKTRLSQILRYADPAQVKERAMPRATNTISKAKQARIKAMEASGYSTADIAKAVGVSTTTVAKYVGHRQTEEQ
jgi:DNA-binding CsgD family transcriptional regulator